MSVGKYLKQTFQNSDGGDLALILSLMVINTIAVMVIIYCYLTVITSIFPILV